MTPEQITQVIQGGQWVSITTELRPSSNKSATGEIQPFYCSRVFTYSPPDRFACTVMNYADANGKVPLVKIVIKGHNAWRHRCQAPAVHARTIGLEPGSPKGNDIMSIPKHWSVNKLTLSWCGCCSEHEIRTSLHGVKVLQERKSRVSAQKT